MTKRTPLRRSKLPPLSRREREIMDSLYRHGRATAAEVRASVPNAPGYSAVRKTLNILEQKGHVRHEQDGLRYVFSPIVKREAVKHSALRHLVTTFFDGSASEVIAALFELSPRGLNKDDLKRLRGLIEKADKAAE